MNLLNEDYLWVYSLSFFLIITLFTSYTLLFKLLLTFICYIFIGGWKFLRVVVLTLPRDLRGLRILLAIKFRIWKMIRNNLTIPDIFQETVSKDPSALAFLYENEQWTFSEFDEYSNKVANYLLEVNVKPGDIIGLFMENRPVYVATWMGISKIGAVPALINFNLRSLTLLHCLKDAQVCGVICGTELESALDEVYEQLTSSRFKILLNGLKQENNSNNICTGPTENSNDCFINGQSSQSPPISFRKQSRKSFDPLMFIYTSGTTGLPKAAKVSHNRFFMMSFAVNQFLRITNKDIIYNSLPLYHTAGGVIGIGQVILAGSCMAVRKKFSASNFWIDCVKYRATIIQYIGEVCRYLLAQSYKPEERSHNVRLAFGNGIRPQIWSEFQNRFNVAQIGEFYGATESNANIINSVNKVGAVGFGTRIAPFVYPITLIKIDLETGKPMRDKKGLCIQCKPNEIGELVGKIQESDPIRKFDGYVNKQATDRKIVVDVFHKGDKGFSTGDLLVQDDLGFFYFKDRLGDTYRWKGENVSTAEVEAVISNILDLNDCAVYGVEVPNCEGRAGMVAIVHVEDKVNGTVSQFHSCIENLPLKMRSVLPAYSHPLFVRICSNIDMTGTFKLKKMDLVKDGFNPNIVTDRLYFLNQREGRYQNLDCTLFEQIMKGTIKF